MNKALVLALATSLFIAGCASTDEGMKEEMAKSGASPALTQAKADLDAAIAAGAQWRIVDEATGKTAVDLSKLYATAEKKAAAGDMAEADRIAKRVSETANIAIEQGKRYAGAMPHYD